MKNYRLLLYSAISFGIYIFFKYAPILRKTREIVENNYNHPKIVIYYIIAKIVGWFLLLFVTMAIVIFVIEFFKKDTKN